MCTDLEKEEHNESEDAEKTHQMDRTSEPALDLRKKPGRPHRGRKEGRKEGRKGSYVRKEDCRLSIHHLGST